MNITNPLVSALLHDMFCNKNNAISAEAIEEETTQSPPQRMTPPDPKGFWHGFHHQPTRYIMTRMDPPREARLAATENASIFAARKYSSCIYQQTSTTSIRRSSTLQRRTPLGTHGYNWWFEDTRSPVCCLNRRSSKSLSTSHDTQGQTSHELNSADSSIVLTTWTHK